MANPAELDDFPVFLDAVEEALGDQAPATRELVRGIKERMLQAADDPDSPGLTAETLAAELVSILSYFELRLNSLESGGAQASAPTKSAPSESQGRHRR